MGAEVADTSLAADTRDEIAVFLQIYKDRYQTYSFSFLECLFALQRALHGLKSHLLLLTFERAMMLNVNHQGIQFKEARTACLSCSRFLLFIRCSFDAKESVFLIKIENNL